MHSVCLGWSKREVPDVQQRDPSRRTPSAYEDLQLHKVGVYQHMGSQQWCTWFSFLCVCVCVCVSLSLSLFSLGIL